MKSSRIARDRAPSPPRELDVDALATVHGGDPSLQQPTGPTPPPTPPVGPTTPPVPRDPNNGLAIGKHVWSP